MKTRYIEDPENIRLETSYVSIDILGEYFAHCYEFSPSDEIMMKLIQRMSQIKKKGEIWKGFKVVKRNEETDTYHPEELLYYFEEDEINNKKVVFNSEITNIIIDRSFEKLNLE